MSNQSEALSNLIQRFAISALSRERKMEALNEEILVGKYTGDFHIKTKDGVFMSADIMNRMKASTADAIRIAELMGMTGEIYQIELENLDLPGHIDYSINFIKNEPIQLPVGIKEMLLNLDLDEYNIVNGEPEIVHSKADVKILCELVVEGQTKYVRFDKHLGELNVSVLTFDEPEKISSIKITEISIARDNDDNGVNERVILLHNMFVAVNK